MVRVNIKFNLQIGKSKVFLRAGQMAELDAHRTRVLGESASMIQGQVRTRLTRERFVLMRKASVNIQANWRGECLTFSFGVMVSLICPANLQC